MLLSWSLAPSLVLAGYSLALAGARESSQAPLHAPPLRGVSNRALTDDVKEYIEGELDRYGVRGMSVSVVHTDWQTEAVELGELEKPVSAVTEYANFGIRSEGGDSMTSDVCSSLCKLSCIGAKPYPRRTSLSRLTRRHL